MKKTLLVIMAALSMLLTQCKKSEAESPSDGKPVNITLNVGGNSKINVNPGDGTVAFTTGDKIYVASGGKYVGTLTAQDNKTFSGTIFGPKEGEPLQFFFLGNKTPNEELTAGTTDEFTINISNQSEELPVISYAPSDDNYSSDVKSYKAFLLNKCALVKFNVSNYTGSGTVGIKGMNNQVTVALNDNTFSYNKINNGVIILNKETESEYWAILLPQDAVENGKAYSSDGWSGTYGNVPAITINGYLNEGIAVNLTAPASLSGFSVSATTKVEFSPGNLYYDGISSSWNFEAHQWEYRTYQDQCSYIDEGQPFLTRKTPQGHWGSFGWSTNNPKAPWGMSISTTSDNYKGTFVDWGYTMDETGYTWRTLRNEEWDYLLNTRTVNGKTGWGNTCVWTSLSNHSNNCGLIIFPDNYTGETTNLHEIPEGAVFLPASGTRSGIGMNGEDGSCHCWSSIGSETNNCPYVYFMSSGITFNEGRFGHSSGRSVRLVRNCTK